MAAEQVAEVSCSANPATDSLKSEAPSGVNPTKLFSDLKQYLGIRYRFGGDSPAGFDCSGFVRFMFSKELNVSLPHSSREMSTMGVKVDRSELRPGDLVFFKTTGKRINHVGIFIGNDTFIHSSLSRGITRDTLNESYFRKRYATAVRIIDLQEHQLPPDFDLHSDAIDDSGSHS